MKLPLMRTLLLPSISQGDCNKNKQWIRNISAWGSCNWKTFFARLHRFAQVSQAPSYWLDFALILDS
ncbi:hypothetical protein [Nostoc sp. PA-18-2419]|uniref:hypothetical protein n=1 Tax=Nostoc sp. PA-18-2419 TaxID=2575443 RepID=UPI0011097343|nr:hypothetical protein [Nostoc sp. PA-18-2419]